MTGWLDGLSSLIQTSGWLAPLMALAAGILTSFTPCSLSAVPLVIGYVGGTGQRDTRRALGLSLTFAAGSAATFTALGVAAARQGHRVLFATATDWVTRLTEAHDRGRLPTELTRLRRYGLIIVDEVGYLPFAQDAANLFFQLVSSRYEHASLILTSNLAFSSWAGVFGDQVVAAAMIDRIVHHADVIALKGASYRLRDRGVDTLPSIKAEQESLN